MSYKHNIIKERFDASITTAGQTEKFEWELDKNADFLFGIAVTADQEELLYYRGTQKIQVNDQELLPEDFESKLLMSGLAVPPNQRMVHVGQVNTGNGKVEVWFKDINSPMVAFTPYRVSFYFFSRAKSE